ncbi:hypothetical protein BZG36_01164 [Bifiguratus adelaidae]|uniref:BZIP domain-containing protein n=1 Tax=Bifiguratus adelaidae TaxID=1938954 RepID=A0A261Y6E0_9FUNG|nr:hypothetical protein BZG36_01164 [Bifiguratus adelaidae]
MAGKVKRKYLDDSLYGPPTETKRFASPEPDDPSRQDRKAQNRAAQRAFRERKERYVKDLETRIKQLERSQMRDMLEKKALKAMVEKLEAQNDLIASSLGGCKPSTDCGCCPPKRLHTETEAENFEALVNAEKGFVDLVKFGIDTNRFDDYAGLLAMEKIGSLWTPDTPPLSPGDRRRAGTSKKRSSEDYPQVDGSPEGIVREETDGPPQYKTTFEYMRLNDTADHSQPQSSPIPQELRSKFGATIRDPRTFCERLHDFVCSSAFDELMNEPIFDEDGGLDLEHANKPARFLNATCENGDMVIQDLDGYYNLTKDGLTKTQMPPQPEPTQVDEDGDRFATCDALIIPEEGGEPVLICHPRWDTKKGKSSILSQLPALAQSNSGKSPESSAANSPKSTAPHMLTCRAVWLRVTSHPNFDFADVDDLCDALVTKAKCTGVGPVIAEDDLAEVLEKMSLNSFVKLESEPPVY